PFEIVDVGAGAGLLGSYLASERPAATYRFIEPIESLRSSLRERFGDRADASGEARYDAAQFVALLDVLEHQQDDGGFLRELVTKMAPGSTLLLTVPALQKLWSQWDVALGHYRRYDKASLLDCTRGLPVATKELSYLFPEMVPFGMLRTMRRRTTSASGACEDADFPELPDVVNNLLYGLGTVSLAGRRRWPLGTSLLLATTIKA